MQKNNIFDINNETTYIEDDKHNKFPVTYNNNLTHIFNHEPINLIDKLNKLKGFGTYRIELLNENRDLLDKVSELLIEKETIFSDEFMEIVNEKYPKLKKDKKDEEHIIDKEV